ncbi:MAG: hypothetical protein EHM35_01170 [Planctomycetaceae bacterium]|nr:MAG: hypothetical protein EHM35_01170 [Planctomycetaceae bacterium]
MKKFENYPYISEGTLTLGLDNMTPQLQMLKDAAEYADGLNTDPKLGITLTIRNYGILINVQREREDGKVERVMKQLLWPAIDADGVDGINRTVVVIDQMLESLRKAKS